MTVLDLSNPTYMVLGSPGFTAPIAMLFADPVNRVELKLGQLDFPETTSIEAYDQEGNSLGLFQNQQGGLEQIALFDNANRNIIAGVSFFVGPEDTDWEGFAIDDVAFTNVVPEPASMAIWSILGFMGFLHQQRRRRYVKLAASGKPPGKSHLFCLRYCPVAPPSAMTCC